MVNKGEMREMYAGCLEQVVAIVVDSDKRTAHIGQMTSKIVEDSEEKDADVVGTVPGSDRQGRAPSLSFLTATNVCLAFFITTTTSSSSGRTSSRLYFRSDSYR